MKNSVPSFVQSSERVKTSRHSVQPVEAPILDATLKPTSPKSYSSGKRKNRKTCFVCRSVDHLIKDCDYHAKKKAQPTPRTYAHRGNNKQNASFTHKHPPKHMVPAVVLTQSKPISITAVRPISADVPKIMVTQPRHAHSIDTKYRSPIRRHITRSPSQKTSNSPPRVTAAQALVVSAAKGNMSYLSKFEELNGGHVAFGGNHKGGKISGKGKIKTGKLDFKDVYFVKELKFNLFSVSQICDKKNRVLFTDTEYLVLTPDFKLPDESQVLLRVPRENNMYNVNLKNIIPSRDLTCLFANVTIDESNLWPRRLGYINFKTIDKLVKRFTWVFFLATKDETSPILKTFITGLENQLSLKVKVIRSDNRTDFKNSDLNQFYGLKGIKRELSVPRTPQQNGITERKNKTLIEAARTMLADSLLPIPFWAVVVNTACYVQNRVLVTKPHNMTRYELLHGRTPSIGLMRPFGCPVTILNTLDPLGKFKGKVDKGFLVGYSVNSKAFRVFNSRTRIVQETLHVNFLENKPNIAGSGPTWLFDIDSLTRTMNYQPVTTGNQSNPSVGFQDKFNAEKARKEVNQQYMLFPVWSSGSSNPQNKDEDASFDGKEHDVDTKKPESAVNVSLSSSTQSGKQDDMTKKKAKGMSPVESFTGNRDLIPTVRQNYSNSTNPFSAAGPSNTNASPTHGKSSFKDASQLLENPDMLEMEDITYSDHENVGAEVDFNNLETSITEELLQFKMQKVWILVDLPHGKRAIEEGIDYEEVFAPAARIEAIRLFLAYASFMGFMVYQMDVKSAFLYETIEEEVYVCQPSMFEDPDHPDKIYKVVNALYGLHQAPRAWYETLANYLLENGFHKGNIDQTLFIKKQKGDILLVQIYVDDIIFDATNKDLCKSFEKLMKDKFQMSSMGELTFFFGLQVKQKKDGIFISQDKYVAEILKKFRLTEGKSASTPIDTEKPSLKDPIKDHVEKGTIELYFFWNTVVVKQSNDVTRLQALVDRKKVVIMEAAIRDVLRLDDAEGVDCLPNEEIFAELARMGYERPSTKLTFYKAFFLSQLKFLIHIILQSMSAKRTSWNEFSSAMASAIICLSTGKGFSGVETPLFEGMLVAGEPEEQGDDVQDQSIPSPTPPTPPPQQPQDLPSTSQEAIDACAALTRLGHPRELSHLQERMIADLDRDTCVALMDDEGGEKKAEDAQVVGDEQVKGRQAEIYQIDMDHASKVLSMQEDEPEVQEAVDVVTTTKLITEVVMLRRKGVVIRDPKEESTTIIPAETKSKDKGKGIMIKEPKPIKKKQQQKDKEDSYVQRYQVMKKKPQTEAQARKNMIMYLKNVAGFRLDYFKGMSYDDIRPIFEAKFNSNIKFLLKSKEQIEEEENRAIESINETPAQKAAKRRKLNEALEDLK
nr:hypothetical protein [Tanacetum cinerariifolium]